MHIFEGNARVIELVLLNIILRGGAANIMRRADRLQDLNQPVGFLSCDALDFGGADETRVAIPQLTRQGNRELDREIDEEFIAALIKRFEQRTIALEVRSS